MSRCGWGSLSALPELGRLFLSGELVGPLAFGTFIITWSAIAQGLWGEKRQKSGLDLWWRK